MESNGVCSGRRDAGSILSDNLLPPCSRKNYREVAEDRETALHLSFPPSFLLTPLELWLPLRADLRARSNTWATRWRTKW